VTRYWLKFARLTRPHPLNLGCGVTAWTLDDALHLVRSAFPNLSVGAPITVMENIDVSTLDPGHVLPTLGDVTLRGVWWPRT
jgi:hypothetical protein